MQNIHRNGISINDISVYELPRKDEDLIVNIDKLIDENLSNSDLSPEMLAEALAMSKSTLTRKMKGMLNITPNNYIQVRRLSIAANLLKEKGYRINEICYTVGFSSPSYFTKSFKKLYGCLPKEYAESR